MVGRMIETIKTERSILLESASSENVKAAAAKDKPFSRRGVPNGGRCSWESWELSWNRMLNRVVPKRRLSVQPLPLKNLLPKTPFKLLYWRDTLCEARKIFRKASPEHRHTTPRANGGNIVQRAR